MSPKTNELWKTPVRFDDQVVSLLRLCPTIKIIVTKKDIKIKNNKIFFFMLIIYQRTQKIYFFLIIVLEIIDTIITKPKTTIIATICHPDNKV